MSEKFNYNYSFEARLHQADDNSKDAFNEVRTLFEGYGLKLHPSWKKIRVSKGREIFALIVFRGKKLAICFALDPKTMAETKYKGKDISDKKLYAKTPFEFKITSSRKVNYLEDIVDLMLMDKFEYNEKKIYNDKFRYLTLETMVERGLVKKTAKKNVEVSPSEIQEVEYVPFQEDLVDEGETVEETKEELSDDNYSSVCHEEFVRTSLNLRQTRRIKVTYNKSRRNLAIINLKELNNYFNANELVDLDSLKLRGLVPQNACWLKVLGDYGLYKPLRVKADNYSYYARVIIKELGGEIL